MWILTVIVVYCALLTGYGSTVYINDAEFASLPPLYGLDDWLQCQRPGDVYCMVDAALYATGPSNTLMLLQKYSEETLKHYNRTQIHRGICVSRCGKFNQTADSWRDAAQTCVTAGITKYGLEAQVSSVEWCTNTDREPSSSGPARALAVLCTVLVALACLATGVHVLGDRCAKAECNRFLLAFSLKRNFDILIYNRRKPRKDDRVKDIACIEGIRFMGMQCIIFYHVLVITAYSYMDNPQFIEKMYDQFVWQAVFNSPLWVQAFFAMSGFLTAYSVLLPSPKPITVFKCLVSIINRWIRLTPVAVFILWFTMAWFPQLGSGPQWSWLVEREATECAEQWWYHIIYAHNHLHTGKFCMAHTWYLAADIQLHIFGVILLFVLMRYRRAIIPVLMIIIIASGVAASLVVYCNKLTPLITAQTPEKLRTIFAGSQIFSLVYVPFWMNLPGYTAGVATAFILHHNYNEGCIKFKNSKWFNFLFHAALFLGGVVTLAGTIFLTDTPLPQWVSALYAALDRTLVAVFFCIFMLGCFSRCWSFVRDTLEWRGFHIVGRLSYCVFLIHVIVLRVTIAGNTQLGHASVLSMISLLITSSVISYVVAVPICLLVELPLIQLWKAVTDGDSYRLQTPDQPSIKVFDLVSHLRRRIDD